MTHMGTNYYCFKAPTKEDKELMKSAIDKGEWGELRSLIPERIHIGKSSHGWVFLFDHNNWSHFTPESIHKFIDESVIYDEYGRMRNADFFWNMVGEKSVYKTDEHMELIDVLWYSKYTDFS